MLPPLRYHWLPDAELEVSVTDPPVQKVVGPPGVADGVDGVGLTVTTVPDDAAELQPLTVDTTVYVPLAVAAYVVPVAPPMSPPLSRH
jgi:hypothetical protein